MALTDNFPMVTGPDYSYGGGGANMNYEEAKAAVFAHGTVPDGYFGKRASVGFALDGKKIVCVADCGYFSAGLPDVLNMAEAIWILKHHPSAGHITITSAEASCSVKA